MNKETKPIVTHKDEPPMKPGRYFIKDKRTKKWCVSPLSIHEGQHRPPWFDDISEYQGPLQIQTAIFGDKHHPGALVPTITEDGERGLTIELNEEGAVL